MPAQIVSAPNIAPALGNGLTVIGCVATAEPQLPVVVYLIVSSPPATPVTTPPLLTVASPLLELQVPPGARSVTVIVVPTHRLLGPNIVPAVRYAPIVTGLVVENVPQTSVTEYLIVSIPELTPVRKPVLVIVASALVTLQVPPGVASV